MDNPKSQIPVKYVTNTEEKLEMDSRLTDTTSGLETSNSPLISIIPDSTYSADFEQELFSSNIDNNIEEEIFRYEDMILDGNEHLESECNAFDFGLLEARDTGTNYDDDVIASDLYVSSTSSSESDNESNDVVDDHTFVKRSIKRFEDKSVLPGRFKRRKRYRSSDDSDDCSSDESESESDEVDTYLIEQYKINSSDGDSENSDINSYDRHDLDNFSTVSSFSHCDNYKKETGSSETGEDKSGLPGRFKRCKRHEDSDDSDDCSFDEIESESDEVNTCLIEQNEINSSDEYSGNYGSDSYDRNASSNSSTVSSFSHPDNYEKETRSSETGDNLGDSDMKRFSDDLPKQTFEKSNANISSGRDVYGRNEHVSTYHADQPDTDILDIMANEDEDDFTDFSDSDDSDDEDSSESSSDEETKTASSPIIPLIPRRLTVLVPLRVILLKYRTIRHAKRDSLSCCPLSCWTDWPIRKIISAFNGYNL
ncbi:hypothetical protein CHS0354_041379 [Potamilus streckersoni]|uniref:Uncharacterized protein n=1 Tax=Potamilus streckersoni TaxID=2493646 RepID=A0AAE0TAJ1_9BIVA|nr:hypothetical protein CHS0354_041379 [Potamilus streckersoni]